MAFRSDNLSVLTYANGFTLWHYKTSDLATDLDTTGYFNAANTMLRVGDFMIVNAGLTTTPANGFAVVTSNSGGVVDVANLTNMASSNTD
jgi:hypothetical protein